MAMNETINLAYMIKASRNIVVFTGAGVSTESGVPDFRSPGGIWERYDPEVMTYQNFVSSAECRSQYWQMYHECWHEFSSVKPNPAHHAIAELENQGKLSAVITQNIDGLHQQAGNSPDKVLELHGTMWKICCLECRAEYSIDKVIGLLDLGEVIPECPECGGLLKPATIAFGQQMPLQVLEEAQRRSISCDLFISIGSSLVVQPAASLPPAAKEAGAALVIINLVPTPLDILADLLIREKAGEVLKNALIY